MIRNAGIATFLLSLCLAARADALPSALATVASDNGAIIGATSTKRPAPKRVVSLSLCLDELLITLAGPGQIAAVSQLARDTRYSTVWQTAQQLSTHKGSAEQIASLQPDLILAADFEQGKAVQVLRQLGFPVVAIKSPNRLAEIPAMVRSVADALGSGAVAEQRLAALGKSFADASAKVTALPRLLALSYAPNGYTAGTLSIKNELLHLAGFETVADRLQWPYDSELGIEPLLRLQPDLIFLEEQRGEQDSLAQRQLQHPALQRAQMNIHRVDFPSQYWLCPGLQLGDAAQALAAAHLAARTAQ